MRFPGKMIILTDMCDTWLFENKTNNILTVVNVSVFSVKVGNCMGKQSMGKNPSRIGANCQTL